MLLLSALWLAVVQALTSLAVPAPLLGAADGPARVASAAIEATAESASGRARTQTAETVLRGSPFGDEEFRPSAPQRLLAFDRTSSRGLPPLRSPVGLAAFASGDLAPLLASVQSRAAHRVSHAAAARGGHLPYYPTAPPLQG